LQVTFILPNAAGALTGTLANGANARVRGVELGADYRPPIVEGLTLSAFVNYNDSHFTQWDKAPCYVGQTPALGCVGGSQNLAGRQLENAPFWSGTVGFDYRRPVGNGYRLNVNASAKWSGAYMSYISYNPNSHQSAYVIGDAAAHFGPEDERWDLALIVRNITDKHYLTNTVDLGAQTPGIPGDVIAYTNRGRQIAIQGSVRF
jgi:outer membrane receptor protein involved in Fe transport